MHDPEVVAFEIRKPWPRRATWADAYPDQKRWSLRHGTLRLAGRGFRFDPIVVVWHVEPGGRDAFTVCKHASHWRWHVHHWQLQFPPLQALRRSLLTRCAWCNGRSTKRMPVNCSFQWDVPRRSFWQRWTSGEPGLYHSGCSSAKGSENWCYCLEPLDVNDPRNYAWGNCGFCGGTFTRSITKHAPDMIAHQARLDAVALVGRPDADRNRLHGTRRRDDA